MSTGNVHLIVTCTRRKTVPAGDAVFPDERDVERAYGEPAEFGKNRTLRFSGHP